MSEFFRDRLNVAHALIDEHDYDTSVEIILNLKSRIHDTDILTKINMHDNEVEKGYNDRYTALSSRSGEPYEQFREFTTLKKWRAQEYLKYYDKISRENDLQ
jgi:hypothetical protein